MGEYGATLGAELAQIKEKNRELEDEKYKLQGKLIGVNERLFEFEDTEDKRLREVAALEKKVEEQKRIMGRQTDRLKELWNRTLENRAGPSTRH